jgi:hypothetical protein
MANRPHGTRQCDVFGISSTVPLRSPPQPMLHLCFFVCSAHTNPPSPSFPPVLCLPRLNNFLLDAWVSKWRGMCGVDGLRALVLGKMRSPIPTAMPTFAPGDYSSALDASVMSTSTSSRGLSRGRRQSMGESTETWEGG